MASAKPRISITNANTMYITPRRLWSTDVNQSFQSTPSKLFFITRKAITHAAMATTHKVVITIGSYGSASQDSLPKSADIIFQPPYAYHAMSVQTRYDSYHAMNVQTRHDSYHCGSSHHDSFGHDLNCRGSF